jgi:cation diffusion facilitator CzcD-associated flavoprotein CzcO
VRTGVDVTDARWDGERWHLSTGDSADVLLTACGQLTAPSVPPLPGLDDFEGPAFHTARWRHDVDLAGRRVAVVGSGCSAIQVVPAIQPEVEHLTVMELGAAAMTRHPRLLPALRAIGRWQINHAIEDPELRRKVTPRDEIGCKRIMITDDWYPTLTRPNVELVTERIAEIAGEGGRTLAEAWDGEPRAYLGITVPGFPNLFLLYGLNTNGGTGSVIYTVEAAMGHVISALRALDRELRMALARSVWHSGCTNWYVDENGFDPNQWPWQWATYRRRTARIEPAHYELTS